MEKFIVVFLWTPVFLFILACIIGCLLGIFAGIREFIIETSQIYDIMKRDKIGIFKACLVLRNYNVMIRELERNYEARITEAQQKISQLQQRLTEANSERKEKYEEWYYHYEILSGAVNSVSKEIEALKQILSVNASSCKIEVDLAPLERTALALLTYLEPYKVELSKEGKDLVEAMNPKK